MRPALSLASAPADEDEPAPPRRKARVDQGLDVLRQNFEQHASYVRSVLARLTGPGGDPDDLLQEVFLVALRRAAVLQKHPEPRAWLYRVAVNVASAARRKAKLRRFFGLDHAEDVEDGLTPQDVFEQAESARHVYRALDRLTEKKRTVFVLYELEGLSGEEIALVVQCPLKTVWTRLHHARKEFAAHIQKEAREP